MSELEKELVQALRGMLSVYGIFPSDNARFVNSQAREVIAKAESRIQTQIGDYMLNELNQETMDAIIKGGGDLEAARNIAQENGDL